MRIAVDGWKAHITFSAAHVIAGHPKCGRLHGHTYAVHVVLHGDAGAAGMVFDFGVVKRAARAIADRLDHRLIVPAGAARTAGKSVEARFGPKTYLVPRGDVALIDIEASSAERLAEYFAAELRRAVPFPPSVHEIEVGVDEGPGQGGWVRVRLQARGERDAKRRVGTGR